MSEDTAPQMLASFFRRWTDMEDRKAEIADEGKDMSAEMKALGFDSKATRAVFRDKRKELNSDPAERQENEAIYDLYWSALTTALNNPPARPAGARVEKITQFPDPHTSKVDGGRPHQSSDAGGAKIDSVHAVDGRAAVEAGQSSIKSEQQPEDQSQDRNEPVSEAASSATPFQPPMFLVRQSPDWRPHCQNPDNCASYKREHCYQCSKAAGLLKKAEAA